jgi:peptidoglycan/xylan/chitin deacetylase (PgdA/CDA1 family)
VRQAAKRSFYWLQTRAARLRMRLPGAESANSGRVAVLALHALAPARREMAVRPERFREQVLALKQAGWRCLPLDEFLRVMSGGAPPGVPSVAFTFDDGYRSVYEHALPVLAEAGFHATVFLTVDFLDGKIRPPWRSTHPALVAEYTVEAEHFQPMEWRQARELAASRAFRIGSHSLSHPLMGRLDAKTAARELRDSRGAIEDRLGIAVTAFSYPYGVRRYGAYSEATERLVREAGYECSFSAEIVRARVGAGTYLIPRIPLVDADTGLDARAKAAGAYDWVGVAQRAYQRIFPNPH